MFLTNDCVKVCRRNEFRLFCSNWFLIMEKCQEFLNQIATKLHKLNKENLFYSWKTSYAVQLHSILFFRKKTETQEFFWIFRRVLWVSHLSFWHIGPQFTLPSLKQGLSFFQNNYLKVVPISFDRSISNTTMITSILTDFFEPKILYVFGIMTESTSPESISFFVGFYEATSSNKVIQ